MTASGSPTPAMFVIATGECGASQKAFLATSREIQRASIYCLRGPETPQWMPILANISCQCASCHKTIDPAGWMARIGYEVEPPHPWDQYTIRFQGKTVSSPSNLTQAWNLFRVVDFVERYTTPDSPPLCIPSWLWHGMYNQQIRHMIEFLVLYGREKKVSFALEVIQDTALCELGMWIARGKLSTEEVKIHLFQHGKPVEHPTFDAEGVLHGWSTGLLS